MMKLRFLHITIILLVAFFASAKSISNSAINELAEKNPDTIAVADQNSQHKINSIVSDEEIMPLVEISVFPNPTSEKITISSVGLSSTLKVNIYNSLGELVKISRISNINSAFDIQLSDLARGVYFVKLMNAKKIIETKKLIVR